MKHGFSMFLVSATLVASSSASAHGGGLNADGCHVNRKTGDYHCHRSPSSTQASFASNSPAQQLAPSARRSYGDTRKTGAYANCAEARAAGAAPVKIGEPGYGAHLDRDGDGIGCEPYRGQR